MSQPLDYEVPTKPPSHASLILGVISIACVPTTFAAAAYTDWSGSRWLIPMAGAFMGLSGIAYRKSSPAVTAWFGMVLNFLVLGILRLDIFWLG